MDMRGLANFIQDIRKATSNKDEEQRRIDTELSKIRAKFRETGKLTPYDRKKYVCKLMFIAMLGYTVDFGHMEGVQLLSGDSNSEKLIGYLSLSVFLNENHELLTLTTHTVHLDLLSGKEFNTSLALTAIGNTGGKDFAEAMTHGVEKLILARVSPNIKKKALLAMLRLYRKYRDVVDLEKIVPAAVELITDSNMGVSTCAVAFIQGILDSSDTIEPLLRQVTASCIAVLERIIMHKSTEVDYIYYSVPAPWLQSKLLRLLQFFPKPPPQLLERALRVIEKIQGATDRVLTDAQTHQRQRGTQNRCNAMNAVLVEVVSLIILWDCRTLLEPCQKILKTFVKDRKEANLRYIGIALTTRLSLSQGNEGQFAAYLEEIQQEIFMALEDPDISIRKKALELLYCTCTQQTAKDVISRFIEHIPLAESSFTDELVLIVAALAEKFCNESGWYCDVILSLLRYAGPRVPKEVSYRIIHTVVNDPRIQKSVTEAAFGIMVNTDAPEEITSVTAFLLGEFGYTIAVNAGSEPLAQVTALQARINKATVATKCVILSAMCKLFNLYAVPGVRDRIVRIFETFKGSLNPEIQQRATEYYALVTTLDDETLQKVLEPIPPFNTSSNIMQKLVERQIGADRDIWLEKRRLLDEKQASITNAIRETRTEVGAEVDRPITKPAPMPTSPAAIDALATPQGVPQPDTEHVRAMFVPLSLASSSGPLFEANGITIGLSQEYRGADGRLTMTIQNGTDRPLEHLAVSMLSVPPNLVLQSRPAPAVIDPKMTGQVLFACRCLGGFAEYPSITITWQGSSPLTLRLPVGVHKFVSPYPLEGKQAFEALWAATTAGNSAFADTPQYIATRHKASQLLRGIGMWVSEGSEEEGVFACGSFAMMPSQTQHLPVLVRLQARKGPNNTNLCIAIKSPAVELQTSLVALLEQ